MKHIVSDLSPAAAKIFGVTNSEGAVIVTKTPIVGPTKDKFFARDVIYAINDTRVTNVALALRLIDQYAPGELINVNLLRNGKREIVLSALSG